MSEHDPRWRKHQSFKTFADADIFNVFLGADEFASEHEIDGRRLRVLVDADRADRKMLQSEKGYMGVFDVGVHFYASASDFPHIPRPNETMVFDRVLYSVRECQESQGMLAVYLARGA